MGGGFVFERDFMGVLNVSLLGFAFKKNVAAGNKEVTMQEHDDRRRLQKSLRRSFDNYFLAHRSISTPRHRCRLQAGCQFGEPELS